MWPELLDGGGEGRQIGGHHALTQIAEVDHGDNAVPAALPAAGLVKGYDRLELALQRDLGEAHGFGGEVGGRRPEQPDGRRDAGGSQPFGVLQTGLAERDGAAGQHRGAHFRAAARDLGHGDDLDARQVSDHARRVVADPLQIDGDGRLCQRVPPVHKTYAREYMMQLSDASVHSSSRSLARLRGVHRVSTG